MTRMNDLEVYHALRNGNVGVLPTDTVYGIVCSAQDKDAVTRLYALKFRDAKPGTLVAASVEQLVDLGVKRRYVRAVEQFWPGPISVIVPCGPELAYLHQGLQSLAVRIPKNKTFQKLLNETGPLLTSSANLPGQPPAQTITEARQYFGDTVDFYVDGGNLSERPASTIIRIVDDAIEIVRQGVVIIDENGAVHDI